MRVAVLAGGRSSEHEISQLSAAEIATALQQAGHEALTVDIDRAGRWTHEGVEITLTPNAGLLGADVVFPALHGPYGEDGTVQGLLDCLDVPYVGSDVLASAVCMDKLIFKQLAEQRGYEQVNFVAILADLWKSDRDRLIAAASALGFPLFVKPSRLGSSVGISKVVEASELEGAIESALEHDPRVIIEQFSGGKEIECAVLEVGGEIEVSLPGEIVFEAEWYDHAAKYNDGGMELIVPARIPDTVAERVRGLARETFTAMGCSGLARADFFVEDERVLLNELNTMPGFTKTSVYAKLFEASGVSYTAVVERLLESALARHRAAKSYAF